MSKTFEFLKPFLNSDGISGFEGDIALKFKKHTESNGAIIERDG